MNYFLIEKDEFLIQNVLDKLAEKYCDDMNPLSILSSLSEEAQDNERVVSTCVGHNPKELEYASERLLSDKDFILTLMTTHNVDLYDYISDSIKCDKDICNLHRRFEIKRKYFGE